MEPHQIRIPNGNFSQALDLKKKVPNKASKTKVSISPWKLKQNISVVQSAHIGCTRIAGQ